MSTLGKILESVVAKRISFAAETFGLLPANHFGARKRRSANQALTLLQEQAYQAWRMGKVLSLVSFDVKGAYNGVCRERLLQRLKARGIPPALLRWIKAFCTNRSASITINGYTTPQYQLTQAGLPQGSPLSPILFLFFNADLVQRKIDSKGGAIAFVDDYSAWVSGESAEANRSGIEAIIEQALDWERRSGAAFEGEKTAIIHFTRRIQESENSPFIIKGQAISAKDAIKILGVTMDTQLRYKEHISSASSKGLMAAMALRRLGAVTPATARRLYEATVTPVTDYACEVWKHACGLKGMALLARVQRIGAQAVTGAFRTVATAVAEAEASIRSVTARHSSKATSFWVNINTLPPSHPMTKLRTRRCRRFASPLQKIVQENEALKVKGVEIIKPYTIQPWEGRLNQGEQVTLASWPTLLGSAENMVIMTSSAEMEGWVGSGEATYDSSGSLPGKTVTHHEAVIGPRAHHNPYQAELIAIDFALKALPRGMRGRRVILGASNLGALQAIARPKQQSGQQYIESIYRTVQTLKLNGNTVKTAWAPTKVFNELKAQAKNAARRALQQGHNKLANFPSAKATVLRTALAKQEVTMIPPQVGRFSRELDHALPGTHTKKIYDTLQRKEANVVIQLRTGMARLNGYLHCIKATDSDLCECGTAKESIKHFLFRCPRWDNLRQNLLSQTEDKRGNLSFYLGGKTCQDPADWVPNMEAIHATIRFALRSKRLDNTTDIMHTA